MKIFLMGTFGLRIKKYRESKGFKVKEFAELVGISQGSLSNIENNVTRPSAETLSLLARKTDIPAHWLLTGVAAAEEPQSKAINLDLIKEVVEVTEDIFQKQKLHLPAKKKAELIILLYEEILEDETKIGTLGARVLKLVKLAS